MKKLIALLTIILSAALSYAQSGAWLVEANGTYKHNTFSDNSSPFGTSVSLNHSNVALNIGCPAEKKFHIGVTVLYAQKDFVDFLSGASGYKTTATTWAAGVWGRYTYTVNSWLFVYTQISVTKFATDVRETQEYTQQSVIIPSEYYGTPLKTNGFNANFYPAVGFNIARGYGLDLSVGGIDYTVSKPTGLTDKELNITFGQQFRLGLHKFLNFDKKEKKKTTD